MTYVVLVGSPMSGYKVYGDFDTIDQAVEWCESQKYKIGTFYSVMEKLPCNSSP